MDVEGRGRVSSSSGTAGAWIGAGSALVLISQEVGDKRHKMLTPQEH